MNPLLDFSGLPKFSEFRVEHVAPAIDQLLADNRALIARVAEANVSATWDAFVQPMEDGNEQLYRAWGQVAHMNAVMNSPELREAYNAALPKMSQYGTELAQHEGMYRKYKTLRDGEEYRSLSATRKRIVDNRLRDFRLGGVELSPQNKDVFKAAAEKLAQLSAKFSDNVLDATNAFNHLVTDEKEIAGIPDDVVTVAREAAQAADKTGWLFTLHMPSYLPLMQYANHRPLRELMYRAYVTRASELGDAALDNTQIIIDLLKLRRSQAQLLGYKTFAQVSLEPKMAESPEQVLSFLRDLAAKAKPFAARDLEEVKQFAAEQLGLSSVEPWDIPWISEKLRVARYAFSEQDVKQYFPEDRVIAGMFGVVETLFGLKITPDQAPLWHPDVRFYRLTDRNGHMVGQFYMDLYARSTKRGGAWMDDAMARRRKIAGVQTPVAYLNCNFSAPLGGAPALFTHDEVITLFHEFGHGLHHLLTKVDDLAVSGINGVEWDAVELPSQFMENFCWEWDVVSNMTRHHTSGASLPRSLFDKMIAAKNFQSGLQAVRQLEFAMFDMRLHHEFDPEGNKTVLQLLNEVRNEVAVIIPPAYSRFANSFSHIFAGGYCAGYYSYKWAEVLSADAYSMFEENGVLNEKIGRKFWQEVLAVGGSRPALESFVAFRGREPSMEALLRHNGMVPA